MRNDIGVEFSFGQEGDAGVVSHHEEHRDLQVGVAFESGQGFGREEMRTDDCVVAAANHIVIQLLGVQLVGHIDRRLETGVKVADAPAYLVCLFKQRVPGGIDVDVRYVLRNVGADKRERVLDLAFYASSGIHRKLYRLGAGVVAFARVAGENQYLHIALD